MRYLAICFSVIFFAACSTAPKQVVEAPPSYGPNDWRDPQATQTFLLKNVVGNDLHVETGNEFVKAHSGKRLPRPQGDLIAETLHGTSGYLYYATATYSWYDPKSFRAQAQQPPMVHAPRVARAHAQARAAPEVAFITADELKTKLLANYPLTIIDVRSSEGYAASSTTIKGLSKRSIERFSRADSSVRRFRTGKSPPGWLE